MPFSGLMFFCYGHDFVYAIWNVIADVLVTVFQGFFLQSSLQFHYQIYSRSGLDDCMNIIALRLSEKITD